MMDIWLWWLYCLGMAIFIIGSVLWVIVNAA
jgi:hypothetical protein